VSKKKEHELINPREKHFGRSGSAFEKKRDGQKQATSEGVKTGGKKRPAE